MAAITNSIKKSLLPLVLTGALLGGGGAALIVEPAAAVPAHAAVQGKHKLVRPGAFCSAADHGKKAKAANGHTYRCAKYANGRWRWKRA